MLEEFGKYQFGITVAHQNLVQLPSHRPPSAASLVLFQLDGDDAQDLALQLDCTPRRTKRVPRRRTSPQYKEWDEEIWDSEETKAAYEAQQAQMKQLETELKSVPKKLKWLERIIREERVYDTYNFHGGCRCEDHTLHGYNIAFLKLKTSVTGQSMIRLSTSFLTRLRTTSLTICGRNQPAHVSREVGAPECIRIRRSSGMRSTVRSF